MRCSFKFFCASSTNRTVWGVITIVLFVPFWLPSSVFVEMGKEVFGPESEDNFWDGVKLFVPFVVALFLCILALSWFIQRAAVGAYRNQILPRLESRYGVGSTLTLGLLKKVFNEVGLQIGPKRARVWTCLMLLVAAPAYHFCEQHLCMGGHMMHPPYSITDYSGDILWIGCYGLAPILALFSTLWWRYILWLPIGFLFFTRFFLYRHLSLLGTGSLPVELYAGELPVQIGLCLMAIVGLFWLRKAPNRRGVFQ